MISEYVLNIAHKKSQTTTTKKGSYSNVCLHTEKSAFLNSIERE